MVKTCHYFGFSDEQLPLNWDKVKPNHNLNLQHRRKKTHCISFSEGWWTVKVVHLCMQFKMQEGKTEKLSHKDGDHMNNLQPIL